MALQSVAKLPVPQQHHPTTINFFFLNSGSGVCLKGMAFQWKNSFLLKMCLFSYFDLKSRGFSSAPNTVLTKYGCTQFSQHPAKGTWASLLGKENLSEERCGWVNFHHKQGRLELGTSGFQTPVFPGTLLPRRRMMESSCSARGSWVMDGFLCLLYLGQEQHSLDEERTNRRLLHFALE